MYVCMYGFGQPYLVVMQAHGLTVKNIPQDHLFSTAGIVCVYVCVRVCVCVCVWLESIESPSTWFENMQAHKAGN